MFAPLKVDRLVLLVAQMPPVFLLAYLLYITRSLVPGRRNCLLLVSCDGASIHEVVGEIVGVSDLSLEDTEFSIGDIVLAMPSNVGDWCWA